MRFDLVEFTVFDQEGDDGAVFAPGSRPVQRAFLRLKAMGRMVRWSGLFWSSMLPSSRNRHSLSQYLTVYFNASPIGVFRPRRERGFRRA